MATLQIFHKAFQSTPLMRGETKSCWLTVRWLLISIHSPHARGDQRGELRLRRITDFNPLPSCEERLFVASSILALFSFQSTPLMRGETKFDVAKRIFFDISIHSPHARRDSYIQRFRNIHRISIHSPHARRDCAGFPFRQDIRISIHSPHARRDTIYRIRYTEKDYFNPLPSCEERQGTFALSSRLSAFQSTPLMRGETA